MKLTLIETGKTREEYLKEGIDIYVRRLQHYAPFRIISIPDIKKTRKTTEEIAKKQEGERILAKINPSDHVVLLDEKGRSLKSEGFAHFLQGLEGRTGHCVFIIGGAYGFDNSVYTRANDKISLSSMTFSHQMVRLIFVEQLYRAYSILNGEPYHHK